MSPRPLPSDADRTRCLAEGEEHDGAWLLETADGLLFVQPLNPRHRAITLWLVRWLVLFEALLAVGVVYVLSQAAGVPVEPSEGLFGRLDPGVQWGLRAVAYGGTWAAMACLTRLIWRRMDRTLTVFADADGVVAEERFGGRAPPRAHRLLWAEIAELRPASDQGSRSLQVVPHRTTWWKAGGFLLFHGESTTERDRVKQRFDALRMQGETDHAP